MKAFASLKLAKVCYDDFGPVHTGKSHPARVGLNPECWIC